MWMLVSWRMDRMNTTGCMPEMKHTVQRFRKSLHFLLLRRVLLICSHRGICSRSFKTMLLTIRNLMTALRAAARRA